MVTRDHIEGGWNQLKGQIHETWGQINEDELRKFQGNTEQLIGLIQRKTGDVRSDIERRIAEMDEELRPFLSQLSAKTREYVDGASQATRETVDQFGEQIAAQRASAEAMVQSRPFESVAVAFGTGLIAGAVVTLLFRAK